jgi:predicted tellurium resistance membrane protein TerC
MTSIASPTLWTAFLAVCCLLLALDLFVLNRAAKVITAKAAVRNTLFFVAMGALFAVYLGVAFGGKPALEFVTGYLIEYALSVDNLFVFLVIFTYFAVLGLRSLYFLLADMMGKFHYLKYGLGLILSFVGVKMLLSEWWHIPIALSLGVIVLLLAGSVVASWLFPPKAGPAKREEPGQP